MGHHFCRTKGGKRVKWQQAWLELEQKKVAPCYLLAGEESYLIRKTVDKIEAALELGELRDLNSERLAAADMDSTTLAAAVAQVPWMARRRLAVVWGLNLGADKKTGSGQTDLTEGLPAIINNLPLTTCLVLCAGEAVDRRYKAVKAVTQKGVFLEFPHLKGQELAEWITQRGSELGLEWERGSVPYLVERAGQSLEQLEMELQKLANYAHGAGRVGRHEIDLLVPESRESRVFALTDAVLAKNREEALSVLEELLRQGETPIGLVGLLAYQVRMVGLAKAALEEGIKPQDLAKTLKAHPFVAQKAATQSRRFNWNELYELIQELAAADLKLKSSGLPAQLVLEQVILS